MIKNTFILLMIFFCIFLVNKPESKSEYTKIKNTTFKEYFPESYESNEINSILNNFEHKELVQAFSDVYGLDWRLLIILIYQESKFNDKAISPMGARGLMQLMPCNYKHNNPENPIQNIIIGINYYNNLYNNFTYINNQEDRIKLTLACYNYGIGNVLYINSYPQSINDIYIKLPNETKQYITKIWNMYIKI